MDAIRDAREVSQRRPRGELNPRGGGALHMKFSRDSAIPRIPAPHLLKQGQLQLAGASFRDEVRVPLYLPISGLRLLASHHSPSARGTPGLGLFTGSADFASAKNWQNCAMYIIYIYIEREREIIYIYIEREKKK